jgi:hypothetical protein
MHIDAGITNTAVNVLTQLKRWRKA